MSDKEKDIWQAFVETLSQFPEDALAELRFKDDLPKELAIKYYAKGFEDARAKQPLSSTEYIYYSLDDALKARGLK